jgi:hypothetical protein
MLRSHAMFCCASSTYQPTKLAICAAVDFLVYHFFSHCSRQHRQQQQQQAQLGRAALSAALSTAAAVRCF